MIKLTSYSYLAEYIFQTRPEKLLVCTLFLFQVVNQLTYNVNKHFFQFKKDIFSQVLNPNVGRSSCVDVRVYTPVTTSSSHTYDLSHAPNTSYLCTAAPLVVKPDPWSSSHLRDHNKQCKVQRQDISFYHLLLLRLHDLLQGPSRFVSGNRFLYFHTVCSPCWLFADVAAKMPEKQLAIHITYSSYEEYI